MEIIDALKWRYATKKFDSSRQLSSQQLDILTNSVQLSASSYGLQPYKVLVITNQGVKKSLLEAAYSQPQVVDSSALFVFAVERTLDEAYVDRYFKWFSETRGVKAELLTDYRAMILGSLGAKSQAHKMAWATSQAYIALGFLLSTAAQIGVDACPMEGFLQDKFDQILGLESKGLGAVVMAAVGFRSPADENAKAAKVRKPANELFIHV